MPRSGPGNVGSWAVHLVPGLRVPRELTMRPGQFSGWNRGLWPASLQGSVPPEEPKSLPEAHGAAQGLRFLASKTICSSVEMHLTLRFIATAWVLWSFSLFPPGILC